MICRHCGKTMAEETAFCEHCGEKTVTITDQETLAQPQLPQGITMDSDGIMRWVYEMNMWKNPTLLITIWKVLLLAALAPALLVFFLGLEDGFSVALMGFLKVGGIVVLIMTGLMLIAYPIVAIRSGGKYCVVFEMNDEGIRHIQMQKQFKKSQTLSMIGAIIGAMAGNPTATGANLLAGSKQSLYTSFSKIKKIVVKKKRHVIYLNEALKHNQIYTTPETHNFIYWYVCDKAKKSMH